MASLANDTASKCKLATSVPGTSFRTWLTGFSLGGVGNGRGGMLNTGVSSRVSNSHVETGNGESDEDAAYVAEFFWL